MRVYLAGAITYYQLNNELYKATEWRRELKERLKRYRIDCFDPTRGYDKHLTYSDASIVKQNQYYLDKCDIIIVNINDILQSPGTMYEIYDYYHKGKPVIAFGDDNLPNQPHIKKSITQYFITKEEVVDYIYSLYMQFNA